MRTTKTILAEHRESIVLYDDDGTPISASRHLNPDGSLGGWVASTAAAPSDCWIHRDAIVLPGVRLASGTRISIAQILGIGELATV